MQAMPCHQISKESWKIHLNFHSCHLWPRADWKFQLRNNFFSDKLHLCWHFKYSKIGDEPIEKKTSSDRALVLFWCPGMLENWRLSCFHSVLTSLFLLRKSILQGYYHPKVLYPNYGFDMYGFLFLFHLKCINLQHSTE